MRVLWLLPLVAVSAPSIAHGQSAPSNMEAYQVLAVRCLVQVPDTARALSLASPSVMPFLRTALVEAWQGEGRSIYLADSTFMEPDRPMPRLSYAVEQAGVTYAPARRRAFERTVTLALQYTYATDGGRLLRDARCKDSYSDMIRRSDRLTLETAAYPETQGMVPRAGWVRRYLEPAVLATVSAVTVFLFFNLRSDRADR